MRCTIYIPVRICYVTLEIACRDQSDQSLMLQVLDDDMAEQNNMLNTAGEKED